uniref:R13L1/DRL21-like LRR repeat region domain-containing protein n=1 Tax=Fagus sylvatica TaxID=28930 RepID=A0A2N9H034_FAGSY
MLPRCADRDNISIVFSWKFKSSPKLMEVYKSWSCNKCEEVPTLGHLPCLKVLEINEMDNVRCIGTKFYSDDNYKNALFPTLRRLKLSSMMNLVEWKDAKELTTATCEVFPCLEELIIEGCAKLTSAPCHFPSLKKLEISEICSKAFENISSKLTTLTSLVIESVSELGCLPEQLLQNNTSLMSLEISYCSELESISQHQDVWAFCTSLRSLNIYECEKLSYILDGLHKLISLENFELIGCGNLRCFPRHTWCHAPSSTLEGAASLRQLVMSWCGVEALLIGLKSCTSLQILRIEECPNLKRISEGLPESLKTLKIGPFCEMLEAFPSLINSTSIQHSIEHLYLNGWAKLNSLPDQIQSFTALKVLLIANFDGMEALPEWLGNLSSLQKLYLLWCNNLMYLPRTQAMRCLTKLHIYDCPKLKERCVEGSRAEWLNVADIPIIIIDEEYIKGNESED